MWYDVDMIKLAELLLPPPLRRKKLFALIKVMILPFRYLHKKMMDYHHKASHLQQVTGQVINLEKALNDMFYSGHDIYITDVPAADFYLYNDNETATGMVMYNDDEEGVSQVWTNDGEGRINGDFIVNVPFYLEPQESLIRNILDRYKVTGRKYIIKYYDYE